MSNAHRAGPLHLRRPASSRRRLRYLRFAMRAMLARRGRAATLAAAIAVAGASFGLLSAAVTTSRAETIGTVSANARSAYDVLVRPKSSVSPVEVARGTVRDNYLSGIFGGITIDEYKAIRDLPGIEVAAPVANLGYVNVLGSLPITFGDFGLRPSPGLYQCHVA